MSAAKWVINYEFADSSRIKSYRQKHTREFDSCLANLARVEMSLGVFGKPGAFHLGFFRPEGGNVWRIGQSGIKYACETRLYVYLYVREFTVYVLTIGDKSQQRLDVQRCRVLAKEIDERNRDEHGLRE